MSRVLPADAPRRRVQALPSGAPGGGARGAGRRVPPRRRSCHSRSSHRPPAPPRLSQPRSLGRSAPASPPGTLPAPAPTPASIALAPAPTRSAPPAPPHSRPPPPPLWVSAGPPARPGPAMQAGWPGRLRAGSGRGVGEGGIAGRLGIVGGGRGRSRTGAGPAPSPQQAGAQPALSSGEGLLEMGGRPPVSESGLWGSQTLSPCPGRALSPLSPGPASWPGWAASCPLSLSPLLLGRGAAWRARFWVKDGQLVKGPPQVLARRPSIEAAMWRERSRKGSGTPGVPFSPHCLVGIPRNPGAPRSLSHPLSLTPSVGQREGGSSFPKMFFSLESG